MASLGIIGGGQLGMMLTEAAAGMPEVSGVTVLDPVPGCPASQVGARQITAGFGDADAMRELAEASDVITYEIESGDSRVLASLSDVAINPSPGTLRTIQDKLLQKSFLKGLDLPVPEFAVADSPDQILDTLEGFGYPALLKARTGGYDGRGNRLVESPDTVEEAVAGFGGAPLMVEKFVPYVMEISVIVARSVAGDMASYPAVENIHQNNILRQTISPARIDAETAEMATELAMATMEGLRGAGVFGIEMFVLKDGSLMINEIAPRVHNSGHHTLQSAHTTQFQQHVRAVMDMDLGSTKLYGPAVMYNILGPPGYTGPYKPPQTPHPNVHLKMYGKAVSKPLRKLGHANLTGADADTLLRMLDSVRDRLAVTPA